MNTLRRSARISSMKITNAPTTPVKEKKTVVPSAPMKMRRTAEEPSKPVVMTYRRSSRIRTQTLLKFKSLLTAAEQPADKVTRWQKIKEVFEFLHEHPDTWRQNHSFYEAISRKCGQMKEQIAYEMNNTTDQVKRDLLCEIEIAIEELEWAMIRN